MITLSLKDYKEFLNELPSQSIDCFISDPPYDTLDKWREMGTTTRLGGHTDESKRDKSQWFKTISQEDVKFLIKESWRILKPNSHAYLFSDHETLRTILTYSDGLEINGKKAWRRVKPLIWDKVNMGMGYTYRCRYEFITFLEKGNKKLNDLGIPDILSVKKMNKGYPTEKPVQLLEILVKQSTKESEIICDPFFGSGSIIKACTALNRDFIGNDISQEAHDYYHKIKG